MNEAPVISLISDGVAGDPTTPLSGGKASYTINEYTNPTASSTPKNGDVVFHLAATDQDFGNVLTYALTGVGVTNPSPGVYVDRSGAFQFDASTGSVTVINATKIDYETYKAGIPLAFSVSDNGTPSLTTKATVTIQLNNLNDAPTFASATSTVSLNENNAANVLVFTAKATDADKPLVAGVATAQHLSYSIVSAVNSVGTDVSSAFAINATTGKVTIVQPNLLDFESAANNTFTLVLRSTDDGTPSLSTADSAIGDQTLTILAKDVNEAPHAVFRPVSPAVGTVTTGSTGAISISAAVSSVGTVLGNLALSDPDGVATVFGPSSVVVTTKDGSSVTVPALVYDPTNGNLSVNNMTTLRSEIGKSFTFTYTVKDSNGGTGSMSFVLTLTVSVTA